MTGEMKKCILCGKKFRVQDWKVGVERMFNLLCFTKFLIFVKDHATEKERKVLEMRFVEHCTLEEVGAEIAVTRERIRQIEGKALERIRMLYD